MLEHQNCSTCSLGNAYLLTREQPQLDIKTWRPVKESRVAIKAEVISIKVAFTTRRLKVIVYRVNIYRKTKFSRTEPSAQYKGLERNKQQRGFKRAARKEGI